LGNLHILTSLLITDVHGWSYKDIKTENGSIHFLKHQTTTKIIFWWNCFYSKQVFC